MPKIKIDQREVEVPAGATVLDAAKKLGIAIPTLCHLEGCQPSTSCLVCLVKSGEGRFVPACGTPAIDGAAFASETDEVRQMRRSALELLLSDHLGDCVGPCQFGCPAQMDIPTMLRQIAAGDLKGAIATIKHDIALPAVLGRVCPAPCEKVCRRRGADGAVEICLLKRFVADCDLADAAPYRPELPARTGKRVAIVGGGPTGLSAAWFLARQGHGATIFDKHDRLGGRLLTEPEETLPRAVLEAELQAILALGVEAHLGERVASLERLRQEYDAVLLACGASGKEQAGEWGLATTAYGIQATGKTFESGTPGLFVAGNAIRGKGMVIRSSADGKQVAVILGQYLAGRPIVGHTEPYTTRIGKMEPEELAILIDYAGASTPQPPSRGAVAGLSPDEAQTQATRCLHCDCRKLADCKLRKYAIEYDASPRRWAAQRRAFQLDAQHAEVLFEPGKCIDCGLCIQIASRAREPLGLTFIGRGFDVRVGVPLGGDLSEAIAKTAAECVAACPTAALTKKDGC